jgi:hypothetical protein
VRDIFALLNGTIRKHGQQQQTVRLRNAWINVDPRSWKTRDDMTINVGLGSGGKAQQFAQTMAIANVQKQLVAGGKTNLVSDRELYNTAAELTRIMGELTSALHLARDTGSEEEELLPVAKLMGEILARIDGLLYESIYDDFPELRELEKPRSEQ